MGTQKHLQSDKNDVSEKTSNSEGFSPKADIELLAGSDQGYFPGLVVSVLSAIKSLDRNRSCRVTIINGGFDQQSVDLLTQSFARICDGRPAPAEIVFKEVDLALFRELPKMGHSAMAYARILAPSLVDADEVVWLDADLIVYRDLWGPFQNLRETGRLLAGVSDCLIESMENDCPVPFQSGDDPVYLNTGLLWMNLGEMRKTDFSGRLLKRMVEWGASLKYWDQTALNYATPHQKLVLDSYLNEFTSIRGAGDLVELIGNVNLHMISLDKPWKTPPQVSTVVRDMIFYKTYSRLTGLPFDEEIREREAIARSGFSLLARFKTFYYGMTGDQKRAFKWRERTIRKTDFEKWMVEIDTRLDRWEEAVSDSSHVLPRR